MHQEWFGEPVTSHLVAAFRSKPDAAMFSVRAESDLCAEGPMEGFPSDTSNGRLRSAWIRPLAFIFYTMPELEAWANRLASCVGLDFGTGKRIPG
jgi:hypothetical protein